MENSKNSGRLNNGNNEDEQITRGIGSENWIQAKRREFDNDIEQHKIREKQQYKADMLFSFEMTLAITIICFGAATLLTRLIAPEIMNEADIANFRLSGLTSAGLLLLIVLSRLLRKRIQRNLEPYTQNK